MDLQTLLEKKKIWDVLDTFPDTAVVHEEMAAVYLDVHPKTLYRLRCKPDTGDADSGIPYIQHRTTAGTTARNQKVSYEMGDLRRYRASQKVKNTMDAAALRGMAFGTLSDMLDEHPFWVKTLHSESRGGMGRETVIRSTEVIVGHLQSVPEAMLKDLVENPDIEIQFLSLVEALQCPWIDGESRLPFHSAYVQLLQVSIDQSNAQQEAAMLLASV